MPEESSEAPAWKGTLLTIFVFSFLAVSLVVYAFFLYFAVGDKKMTDWHFGIIEDVPGSSPYSTSRTRQYLFNATTPETEGRVIPQHVNEDQGVLKNHPDPSGNKGRDSR